MTAIKETGQWKKSSRKPLAVLRDAVAASLAVIYPPLCPLCHGDLGESAVKPALCDGCVEMIWDRGPACSRCARPLPAGIGEEPHGGCSHCSDKSLGLHRVISIGVYGKELRDVVLRIKQTGNDVLTAAVGQLLGRHLRELNTISDVDLLAPTPTHWLRRVMRGGCCTELLADAMATALRIPVAKRLLTCHRKTKKQGMLLPSERRKNVRNAFRVSAGYDIKDAHVLLVDDVMTTGATAGEMSRVLRKAGATTVSLAVVARGIGFDGQ